MVLLPHWLLTGCVDMPKLSFNTPPSAPEVAISPTEPTTQDSLTYTVLTESVDPEGEDVSYRYQWYRNDDAITVGEIVPSSTLARGDIWRVEVSGSDGELVGAPGVSEVTIGNIDPVLTEVHILPEAPMSADDLSVSADGSDADHDTLTYSYRWTRDGVAAPEFDDAPGIPAATTQNDEVWEVAVTANDGLGLSATVTDAARIGDTAPTLGAILLSPDTPRTDSSLALTITGLADADGDPVTALIDWMRDGVVVATDEQTTIAYYPLDLSKGEVIQAAVRPFDGYAEGTELLSNAVTVINDPPVLDGVTLTPDPGYETSTLQCTPGTATDLDADSLNFTYRWVVDGRSSRGSDTLDGADFDRGDDVYCAVTPDDGDEEGPEVVSNTITIENSAPSISAVSMNPDPPTKATGSSAVVSGWSDPDGDAQTLSYGWYVNGTARSASASISGSALTRGDEVVLTVIPSDGTTSGVAMSAGPVTVANSPPTISSVSVTPSSAYTDDTLSVSIAGFSDADGDPETEGYQWYKNRVAIGGATTTSLAGDNFTRGDQVYCAVTPNDGLEDGATVNSNLVTILNSSPSLSAGVVTSGPYTECDEIQLGAVGTDDDGDALSYTWTLTSQPAASMKDSDDITSPTDAEPTFIVDAEGTFRFQAAVEDGYGTDYQSFEVSVEPRATNTDPAADAGSDQTVDLEATCSYSSGYGVACDRCPTTNFTLDGSGTSDAEGDSLEYEWTLSGSPNGTLLDGDTDAPTVTVSGVVPSYGFTTTVTITATMLVGDCAGGADTDEMTITYTCTGI